MQKIKMIGLVLLAGIVICGAAAYKENPEKITLRDFTMAMDNSGMTGWHNGKKQWKIQAGSVIKEQDKIIFRNVHNGMFMRDGQSPVQFHASLAEYNKEKGYIDFPEGLAFIVDDQSITIGKANWSEKDNRLTAEKISIAKADGIELKAEKMIFESTANCLTWQGPLDIIKSSEKDHKLVITTNQANYFPQDKKWQMDTQAEIKVFEGELLFCVIQTSHMVFQTDGAQVSFLDKVNITGESFSGECSKATLNDSILIGEDVHLNHNKLGMLTAGSMSATRDEHYLFRNGVTCSRGNGDRIEAMQADVDSNYDMKFSNAWGVVFGKKETKIRAATLVYHQNQDVAANGEVEVNRDEIILQSDSMDISSESSMIIANGNVVVQDGKGNVINTTRAKHDGKDRISFTGNVSIKQNNGTLVNGDFAEYDEKNKQIFVKGNIKAVKADGRWLKADVMQYDIEGRKTEFTGQVESGINE